MVHSNADQHKAGGSSTVDDKPAVVVVLVADEERTLDATHHIVTDGKVHVYLNERSDGIDATLPLSRCLIARSQEARDALDVDVGGDTNTDEEPRTGEHADEKKLVTDGGSPADDEDDSHVLTAEEFGEYIDQNHPAEAPDPAPDYRDRDIEAPGDEAQAETYNAAEGRWI